MPLIKYPKLAWHLATYTLNESLVPSALTVVFGAPETDVNRPGIYILSNVVSGKYYIGSATSFQRRWGVHLSSLMRGIHGNVHLQRAWNRYSYQAFKLGIIEFVEDTSQLLDRERVHIERLRNTGLLYNMCSPDTNPLGRRHSPEAIAKISAGNKGKNSGREPWSKGKTFPAGKWKNHGPLSLEHRERIREGLRGHAVSQKVIDIHSSTWRVTFPDGHCEDICNMAKFLLSQGLKSKMLSRKGYCKGYKAIKLKSPQVQRSIATQGALCSAVV